MSGMNTSNRDRILRDPRVRDAINDHSPPSITPNMEDSMFNVLMKNGAYRVDYLNMDSAGAKQALGLYVFGNLAEHESYSHNGKHDLYQGLALARENFGIQNLVAVYLDINSRLVPEREAYMQMKRDKLAGMFHRVFVLHPEHLFMDPDTFEDWWRFYRQLPSCEILTNAAGKVEPVSLFAGYTIDPVYDLECSQLSLAV